MAAEHVERIGARIRKRREELGLSRRRLIERMEGVATENDLYRWERGQHRPKDDTLETLARALEVDAAYFLAPEPEPGTADVIPLMRPGNFQAQLDRVEAKLDAIRDHLGIISDDDRSGLERDLGSVEPPAEPRARGSASKRRGRRAEGR